MKLYTQAHELQADCLSLRSQGKRIAFVPTMGFLHAGHESLLHHAREMAEILVLSVFVNPSQFGPHEDLAAYPRSFDHDLAIAKTHKVNFVFAPSTEALYQADHDSWVTVEHLSSELCGRSRPGHFRGVATVVAKLLNIIQPDYALFGQKDWQQLLIIKRMCRDLCFPTRVIGLPTFRETDGLAMSSRNAYLSLEERRQAPYLFQGLLFIREEIRKGRLSDTPQAKKLLLSYWEERLPLGEVDYLDFVHPETLEPVNSFPGPLLIATAIKLGKARLIDNLLIFSSVEGMQAD